mgnify:CR=1 FL=1
MIREVSRPEGGSASGHAAAGFVAGQRNPDGSKPSTVLIVFRRKGKIRSAHVCRSSNSQQVEDTADSSVRFPTATAPSCMHVRADAVLAADPFPFD